MNDQSQMIMNNQPPPQVMNPHHPQLIMNNQPPPQVQILSQTQPNPQIMNQSQQFMINQSQQRSYNRMWPPHQTSIEMMNFPNPNPNRNPNLMKQQQGFVGSKPRNWKGKKANNDKRRKEKQVIMSGSGSGSGVVGGGGGYKPPTLNDLQHQNRLRARKFYPKKKYSGSGTNNRFAPYAPRNTSSFIIRAKKSGGIASLVSPCPVTPAVLPTPIFSPSREVLGDMAKEEWGVNGYGSMKGLIRLRNEGDGQDEDDEEEGSSSESDVEEHVEVERRLDHDLSRFEMICPNYGVDHNNVLENRVDDQDSHIAQLEEENLILKERLFLMERDFVDLRRRLQYLERQKGRVDDGVNNESVENVSDNESEGNNDEVVEETNEEGGEVDAKEEQHNNEGQENNECARDVCMEESVNVKQEVIDVDMSKDGGVGIHGNESACTEEFVIAQKEVIDENQSKCEGVGIRGNDGVGMEEVADEDQPKEDGEGNGSLEKIIGDSDLSNRPVLL